MDNAHHREGEYSPKRINGQCKLPFCCSDRGGNLANAYFSCMCCVIIGFVYGNTIILFNLGEKWFLKCSTPCSHDILSLLNSTSENNNPTNFTKCMSF